MLTFLGSIFTVVALIGLFIVSLIVFPSLRKAIKLCLTNLGKWITKHLLLILLIVNIGIAILIKDFTLSLLYPFSQLAVIILGICILCGCIWKRAFKFVWQIGTLAAAIIFITVILEKLPW